MEHRHDDRDDSARAEGGERAEQGGERDGSERAAGEGPCHQPVGAARGREGEEGSGGDEGVEDEASAREELPGIDGAEVEESGRGEPGTRRSTAGPGAGWFGWGRTVEVEGERRPVASLLRRGAALAVDLCFALLAVAIAIDVLSFHVPIDTDRAAGPMFSLFGLLVVYIVWLRDRGASRPGGGLRFGLSVGRWLLALRLVPVAGPRRFTRPVTVADTVGAEGETMRIVRAVLLGVAASLVTLLLLGYALAAPDTEVPAP